MSLKKIAPYLIPLIFGFALFFSSSCRKEKILTSGGQIRFSVDTLMFDTVFTAQGSSTRKVKIYNEQKETIRISSIRFRRGTQSSFRLNINGEPGTGVTDVEIAGNDSLWVFAAVTVDPNDEHTPFIVNDELLVTLNGTEFSIPVIAYGQNAYYIVDSTLNTQTWKTDRPYVIMHNALVDLGQTLTIPAGVRVYVHQDSRLYVRGTLKIQGTKEDSVVFQGDRLDPLVWIGDYLDIPGQWGGIYFTDESYNNEIDYAVFKNGGAVTKLGDRMVEGGTIQVDRDTVRNGIPKLRIKNTVIRSSQTRGLLAYTSTIHAENCRIVECGQENVALVEGGDYKLDYCTIGTYGSTYLSHSEYGSMVVQNYRPISQTEYVGAPLQAQIRNCIVYGSLEYEAIFDYRPEYPVSIVVNNSLLRNKDGVPAFVTGSGNILNQDPMFKDRATEDYHLLPGSPAIGKGIVLPGITKDLDGYTRDGAAPTIGCFEYRE